MSTADGDNQATQDHKKKRDNYTQSQKASAYFNMDDGYDPLVYENTTQNYFKIVGMLIVFYIFQGLHWWAMFSLVVHDAEMSTVYNLCVFGVAVLVIAGMLIYGAGVNQKKITHEYYMEVISAEKLRIAEEQARAAQKAANDAKLAEGMGSMILKN